MLNVARMCKTISRGSPGLYTLRTPFFLFFLKHILRSEFRRNAQLDKKDFGAIEYLLRKGQRQLEIYSSPRITNIVAS